MNDLTRVPVTRHLLSLSAFIAASSVASTAIQAVLRLMLVQREFRRRLVFAPAELAGAIPERPPAGAT